LHPTNTTKQQIANPLKLTSMNLEDQPPAPPSEPAQGSSADMPVWLQRTFVGVYVLFCIELGLVLITLPWTRFWFNDGWLAQWPQLQHLLQQGFVRGAVSGLGLLDIWLGVLEAIRYRDRRSAGTP
jgi:hypothetical protein